MDTTPMPWTVRAEEAIHALRDIQGVRIRTEDDQIREIHVVAAPRRPAKLIVRDVVTLLEARFHRTVDHRIVSVAFLDSGPGSGGGAASASTGRAPEAGSERAIPASPVRLSVERDRIRFVSANVFITGRRAQAQVELRWKGVTRMGSAAGHATRDGARRLVANATLAALQEFFDERVAIALESCHSIRLGNRDLEVVALELLAHRSKKTLAGCCTVEEDAEEAVVLATLSALNRIVSGLPTREPTEYVLRPTSVEET